LAWRIPTSIAGTITVLDLGTADSAFIASGVLISASIGEAVAGRGDNQKLIIEGTVAAPSNAVNVSGGFDVEVRENGLIQGLGASGISISNAGSTLVNRGRILQEGNVAVFTYGSGAAVTNFGLIESALTGFGNVSTANGAFTLDNFGTIRAGGDAYRDDSSEEFFGPQTDTVRNAGTIIGNVLLGRGDDLFDGRAGAIDGVLYGGVGNDRIFTGTGANRLFGGDGNDTLIGGSGGDYLSGGIGRDTASYAVFWPV
jgi:Ca2+-binding RTX toxin-like protein